MKILFLGTGAADWKFEDKQNPDFRRNSSALINDDLLIDPGVFIFDFMEDFKQPDLYDNVVNVIITHVHSDHYNKESILRLAKNKKIRLGCCGYLKEEIGEHENIEYIVFNPYEEAEIGGYKITPLLANHDVVIEGNKYALHYIIEKDGKTLFYGLDGAWFLRPSWQIMLKKKFDVMVFDCTAGDYNDWRLFEHNTIPMLRIITEEIKAKELVKENGKLVATHMAKTLHVSQKETTKILAEFGMEMAFDGFKIEF